MGGASSNGDPPFPPTGWMSDLNLAPPLPARAQIRHLIGQFKLRSLENLPADRRVSLLLFFSLNQ